MKLPAVPELICADSVKKSLSAVFVLGLLESWNRLEKGSHQVGLWRFHHPDAISGIRGCSRHTGQSCDQDSHSRSIVVHAFTSLSLSVVLRCVQNICMGLAGAVVLTRMGLFAWSGSLLEEVV